MTRSMLSPEIKKRTDTDTIPIINSNCSRSSMFKEVGVPLKQIKPLLTDKTPEGIITLLKEKSSEIESKIKSWSTCKG